MLVALALMAVIAALLSGLKTKLSISALVFPIAYANGLKGIASALVALKDLTDAQLGNGLFALLVALSVMAVIAEVLSGLKTKLSISALAFPIAYANGLKGIAKAIVALKDLTDAQLGNGLLALLVALSVMAIIAVVLSGLKTKLSISALAFPIAYANGLLLISKAILNLKGLTEQELLDGMLALMSPLVLMGIIAIVLSGLKTKLDPTILALPIAFATGLLILAVAIKLVGSMAQDDLLQGVVAMLATMIVMGAIITVMSNFSEPLHKIADVLLHFAVSAAIIAVAFGIISVSLIALAFAIGMFEGVDVEQVGVALLALAGAMTILVIAANALTKAGVGLIFLGTAFIMIAVGVYVLVEALVLLANNFDKIGEMIPKIGNAIVTGLASFLQGFVNFIISYLPLILVAGMAIMTALGSGIAIGIPLMPVLIGALLLAGLAAIFSNWDTISKAGASVAEGIGNGIMSAASWVVDKVKSLGDSIVTTFKNVLGINSPSLVMALAGLDIDAGLGQGITGGSSLATDAAALLGDNTKNSVLGGLFNDGKLKDAGFTLDSILAGGINQNSDEVTNAVDDMSIASYDALVDKYGADGAAAKLAGEMPEGMAENIENNSGELLNSITGLSDTSYEELMKQFGIDGDLASLGGELPEGIADNIDLNSFEVPDSINSMLGEAGGSIDYSSFEDSGQTVTTRLAEGIEFSGDAVTEALTGVIEDAASAINDSSDLWEEAGENITSSLSSNVESAADSVKNNTSNSWKATGRDFINKVITGMYDNRLKLSVRAKEVSREAANNAKTTRTEWIKVGSALSDGLASGVRNHAGKVIAAAESAAKQAYEAAKRKLGVKSPSRVFAELGKYVDLGLAKGILDNARSITVSTESAIGNVISTAEQALAPVADLLSSDIIDDPVIRPVMDLSEIQNGANQLYSMMDEAERYTLNGNVDLATDTFRSVDRDQTRKRKAEDDNSKALVSAITALKDLVNTPRNTYVIDGITYDDGSNVSDAIRTLVRAAKVGGRA